MHIFGFDIKRTGRAALAAVLISASILPAIPAQAAPRTHNVVTFQEGATFTIRPQGRSQAFAPNGARAGQHKQRVTNRDIRRGLRSFGFRDIRFARERRNKVRVFATMGPWEYSMRVNLKTGRVNRFQRHQFVGIDRNWFLFQGHGFGGFGDRNWGGRR